jgi:uncharacterized membrane protein
METNSNPNGNTCKQDFSPFGIKTPKRETTTQRSLLKVIKVLIILIVILMVIIFFISIFISIFFLIFFFNGFLALGGDFG